MAVPSLPTLVVGDELHLTIDWWSFLPLVCPVAHWIVLAR